MSTSPSARPHENAYPRGWCPPPVRRRVTSSTAREDSDAVASIYIDNLKGNTRHSKMAHYVAENFFCFDLPGLTEKNEAKKQMTIAREKGNLNWAGVGAEQFLRWTTYKN